jgi:HlyD family secretion protein
MAAHFDALIAVEQNTIAMLEREIENSTIVAPVDGTITTLHAKNTNVVAPASPVAEITVPGGKNIEAYVSTQDIMNVSTGDNVLLTLKQRMDDIEFRGTVIEIDSTAVLRYSALGVEERRVKVTVSAEMPADIELGVGYEVDVTFRLYREENRLTVPRTALFKDDGRDVVWVVRGGDHGAVMAAPVETGKELRTRTVIESGLQEGDFVVNDADNQALRDGARVKNKNTWVCN